MFAPHGFNLPVASPAIRAATAFMGREHCTCVAVVGLAARAALDEKVVGSIAGRPWR